MSDIANRVRAVIVDHLGIEEIRVTDEASFIDDLGADSLDAVELIMEFEDEFDCDIPDNVAKELLTVKDVVLYLSTP